MDAIDDRSEDRSIAEASPDPEPPVGPEIDPEAVCGGSAPNDPDSWVSDPANWPAWTDCVPYVLDRDAAREAVGVAHPRPPVESLRARGMRTLAQLAADPDYLACKEAMGEALAPAEREVLEAARSARGPVRIGGGAA